MTIIRDNYKRYDLFVDTNIYTQNIENTPIPFWNNNENNIQNNNYNTFKCFISSIIKIQNISDKAIKINIIGLVFILNLPQIFLDLYFQTNLNILSKTYLLVSIVQKQTFSLIFCYYIVSEDLIKIVQFPNGNKYMMIFCKIDTFWCEYYSILGIIIVIYNWFINRYMDHTNIYILVFSILKLAFVKNIIKKMIINLLIQQENFLFQIQIFFLIFYLIFC